jgi:putative hydrolase of the HAD superfamily
MGELRAVLCDIGGVLLTNGWDHDARAEAAETFRLDAGDFEARHGRVFAAFETGRMSLDDYLGATVFHRERSFTPRQFSDFMYAQSEALPGALEVLRSVAATGRYRMATLNNEPLELNLYRIERFRLREVFTAFFSSCFVGARKPDERIYRAALRVLQLEPEECLFIDDRPANLEPAGRLGMAVLECRATEQLARDVGRALCL